MQETWVWSLGREDPQEEEMATHSSTLAWKIPWGHKSWTQMSMHAQCMIRYWNSKVHLRSTLKVIVFLKSSPISMVSITNSEHIYISFSPNCGCVLWFVTSPCLLLDHHSPKGRVHASFFIISSLFLALNCAWRLLTWTSISLKAKKKWFTLLNWPRRVLVKKCYICIRKGKINWQYIVSPEWYLDNLSLSPLTFKSWKIL